VTVVAPTLERRRLGGSLADFIRRNWLEIVMVLPLVIYILGFTLVPTLQAIQMGFVDEETKAFPSLANYRYLLNRPQFGRAFINHITLTLTGLALEMTVGMIVALVLHREFKGRGILRATLMVPMGVPTLVSGIAMIYILSTTGYLNELLFRLNLTSVPIDWRAGGVPGTLGWVRTLLSVVLADMWKVTPMVSLILLAGLESIPQQIYEAANIDGASAWQTFWKVTFPLLRPSLTMAFVIRGIDAFRIFDLPMVLMGRVFMVITTYAYDEYQQFHNYNISAAAATILFVLIIICISIYLFVAERGKGEAR